MPCYESNVMSVEFKPENRAILDRAVRSMGWTISPDGRIVTTNDMRTLILEGGQVTGEAQLCNTMRVAYSRAAVRTQMEWAKAKGWTAERKSENVIRVTKGLR